jgi:plasmid stabilization system protein ParE
LKDNPSIALEILNEIDDTVSKLANFPELGKQPKNDRLKAFGYRILLIKNYLIFYILTEKFIEIHRVLHSSRDYTNLL